MSFFLPDEQGIPLLMYNDVSSVHEHGIFFCLYQAVLSQSHSVLPATAVS